MTRCNRPVQVARRTVRGISMVLLGLCVMTHAQAKTYTVAPTGSDSAPGSLERPWRTLGFALTSLQPGDVLSVRGGTYVERLNKMAIHPGTSSNPITVRAYPGERPVLKGLLWLMRPSYWTIDGLNVTWDPATGEPREHMVKLTNGVGWTYKNAEIWGAQSFAAMLVTGTIAGEPANWSVVNNCVHDTLPSNKTNQDHLIYANTGVDAGPGLIAGNLLYNAANGEGIKLGGAKATQGTANVVVRGNTIYNTAQSILISWESHDNQIYGNLLALTKSQYGCIRGYRLTGKNNVAHDNIGGESRQLLMNDRGYESVRDTGGNVLQVAPETMTALHRIGAGAFRQQDIPRGAPIMKKD